MVNEKKKGTWTTGRCISCCFVSLPKNKLVVKFGSWLVLFACPRIVLLHGFLGKNTSNHECLHLPHQTVDRCSWSIAHIQGQKWFWSCKISLKDIGVYCFLYLYPSRLWSLYSSVLPSISFSFSSFLVGCLLWLLCWLFPSWFMVITSWSRRITP